MTITVITPTGARPEAFHLCQLMLKRQTYQGSVRWIIIDDGQNPQDVWLERDNWSIDLLRPRPLWRVGKNTQQRNLKAALEVADWNTEALVVIEDDDHYSADWLQFVADHIHEAELIGECNALYYNVFHRVWDRLHNEYHASLRCSAMRGDAIKTFDRVISVPDLYYDMQLWKRHVDRKVFPQRLTIGMKGLPGRGGIALGHDGFRGRSDDDLAALRSFIGDDAEWYAPFWKNAPELKTRLICVRRFLYHGRQYEQDDEFHSRNDTDTEVLYKAGMITRVTSIDMNAQQALIA